jgi:hypothetical protein
MVLAELGKRVFEDRKGAIYIGGERIPDVLLSVLKDESRYILKSRIWEIIEATVINESAELALNKSLNWEHVLSAKQLFYWRKIVLTIIQKLAQ